MVDYDLAHVAGAHQYTEGYHGTARMPVDADRGTVVGVTFVGPGGCRAPGCARTSRL
ncbi:hypothetical protein ABT237_30035 [Streptomyces sp. NPDC001581]|uniref:hypothetical protein n=1 Tax=Streptomyces sp. NPDC001581 TaxID=3154386 RepID=UPI00332380F7